jgi:hypothetical protein
LYSTPSQIPVTIISVLYFVIVAHSQVRIDVGTRMVF